MTAAKKFLAAAAAIFLIPSAGLAMDQAPGLNINGTNVPVGEILKQIEAQAGYTFAYNKSAFDHNRRITINVAQANLEDVLDYIFEDAGFAYVVNNKHILLFPVKELEDENRWTAFPVVAKAPPVVEAPAAVPRPQATPPVVVEEVFEMPKGEAVVTVNRQITTGAVTPEATPLTYPLTVLEATEVHEIPRLAVKTNLLFDAFTTLNLGLELRIAPKWTVELTGYYNPWKWANNRTMRNIMVQPEFRYWIGDPFSGHFVGIHAQWAHYNLGNLPIAPFQENRYQGELYGAGVSYGYSWLLGPRWRLEATLGLGYNYLDYRKYSKVACGACYGWRSRNYIGVTKAGINVSFLIK